ncbi:Mobile element protein, partial [Klebsiella pneumoniae]
MWWTHTPPCKLHGKRPYWC